MKKILTLSFLIIFGLEGYAQYVTSHHIAPAPWQYWSDANELVLSTLEEDDVTVSLFKSDGTFITDLTIPGGNYAIAYRFNGDPTVLNRNETDILYTDRGLLVEATAPVMANIRNIASDNTGTTNLNIKGNASLVSLGNQGQGRKFRLGYYRSSFGGIATGNPIYTVMATVDNTNVTLNGTDLTSLNQGESYVFNASTGDLLEATEPVVTNVGSYGDTPNGCSGNGEDGTFTQLPPVNILDTQYVVVRGDGVNSTTADAPEQTTIIASEDNTTVGVINYDTQGNFISSETYTLDNAGDFETFLHGDEENQYSSSHILSNFPIAVYAGTAVDCETDISTVLPIGGCAGTNSIYTRPFLNYEENIMPYFCYVIIESETIPVYVNGNDIEALTGNIRTPIGTSGFYVIHFENTDIGDPDPLLIESETKLTTSIVQQGVGFSMSGFFSAYNEELPEPEIEIVDCEAVLTAVDDAGPYQWYLNGEPIDGATNQQYEPQEVGTYSVSGTRVCGETLPSEGVYLEEVVPIELDLGEDRFICESPFQTNLIGIPTNIQDLPDTVSFEWYFNGDLLSDTSSSLMVTEPGSYSVTVSYNTISCSASDSIEVSLLEYEVDLGEDVEVDCDTENHSLFAELISNQNIDPTEVQFMWNTGETTQEITVTQSGIYTVEATYGDCTETDEVTVTFAPDFEINLEGEVQMDCEEESLTLFAGIASDDGITASDVSFEWSTGETSQEIAISEPGTYTVTATHNSCVRQGEVTVTATNLPEVSLGENITKCPQTEVTITAAVENEISNPVYTWFHNGNQISGNNPEISITEFGIYLVQVTSDGCTAEDEVEVIPYGNQGCVIPQAISPNNDGLNDSFELSGWNVEQLEVFNRNGIKVYSKTNYTNQWYGQTNSGETLPVGTYFYVMKYQGGKQRASWVYINK